MKLESFSLFECLEQWSVNEVGDKRVSVQTHIYIYIHIFLHPESIPISKTHKTKWKSRKENSSLELI